MYSSKLCFGKIRRSFLKQKKINVIGVLPYTSLSAYPRKVHLVMITPLVSLL